MYRVVSGGDEDRGEQDVYEEDGVQEVYTGLEEATTSAGHRLASGISSSIGNNFPSLTYNFNK